MTIKQRRKLDKLIHLADRLRIHAEALEEELREEWNNLDSDSRAEDPNLWVEADGVGVALETIETACKELEMV